MMLMKFFRNILNFALYGLYTDILTKSYTVEELNKLFCSAFHSFYDKYVFVFKSYAIDSWNVPIDLTYCYGKTEKAIVDILIEKQLVKPNYGKREFELTNVTTKIDPKNRGFVGDANHSSDDSDTDEEYDDDSDVYYALSSDDENCDDVHSPEYKRRDAQREVEKLSKPYEEYGGMEWDENHLTDKVSSKSRVNFKKTRFKNVKSSKGFFSLVKSAENGEIARFKSRHCVFCSYRQSTSAIQLSEKCSAIICTTCFDKFNEEEDSNAEVNRQIKETLRKRLIKLIDACYCKPLYFKVENGEFKKIPYDSEHFSTKKIAYCRVSYNLSLTEDEKSEIIMRKKTECKKRIIDKQKRRRGENRKERKPKESSDVKSVKRKSTDTESPLKNKKKRM